MSITTYSCFAHIRNKYGYGRPLKYLLAFERCPWQTSTYTDWICCIFGPSLKIELVYIRKASWEHTKLGNFSANMPCPGGKDRYKLDFSKMA
jgi:hypothetical protein